MKRWWEIPQGDTESGEVRYTRPNQGYPSEEEAKVEEVLGQGTDGGKME